MSSTNKDPFEALLSSLPKRDGWWDVAWMKSLLLSLQRDRARGGDNIEEIPAAKGRFFKAKPGSNGGSIFPFSLLSADVRNDAGDITANKVRITTSTLFGDTPDGFSPGDTPPYLISVSDGDVVYAILNYNDSNGTITGRSFSSGSSLPDDDDGTLNIRIGSVSIGDDGTTTGVNDRYGPILGTICPDYFSNPVKYSATVTS